MSSTTEFDTFTSRSSEASTECKPLLEVATKDLFRKNAFRITGLPVDATPRDIAKHAEKLKLLAELGQNGQANAAFPLRPSPTLQDIRDAIQRLKDPEKRLIDEFFWFWPENFGESRSDAAIQALEKGDLDTATDIWMSKRKHPTEGIVATHNLALIFHISALDWENHFLGTQIDPKRRDEVDEYWKAAFHRWGRILTNEQLWEKVVTRVRQLNEPNLTTGFVRRMRAMLPVALDKINAELAIAFAESGKLEPALLHIQLMRATSEGLANAEKTAELVLMPAKKRLTEQVRQANKRAEENPRDAMTAARELLEHVRDTLALFDLFFDKDNHFRNDVFDEVAEMCNRLQVTYHKATNDNETCLEFLKVVLPFAASQEVREQIEKNIQTLTENIEAVHRDKKFYGNLRPISSAPDLSTVNGWGHALYGSTDVDTANGSYLATYYFCILFIPIFPICRYRVIRDGASYRFLGKAPLRTGEKWHLAIFLGVIVSLMIAGYASSQSTPSRGKPAPSYIPQPRYGPYIPGPRYSPYTPQPRYIPGPSYGSANSDGNRYRIPSWASSTLAREKAEIESASTELHSLGSEIERDRLYLDQTNEFSVNAFNAKVHRYNATKDTFNQRVDDYNAKLRSYSR